MATAPTVTSYTASDWEDQTNNGATETAASVARNAGDIVVVVGAVEDSAMTINTPTGTGLTFQLIKTEAGASNAAVWIWYARAQTTTTGDITATTVSSANQIKGIGVFVVSGCAGCGNVASINNSTGRTISLTRLRANSAVVAVFADWSANTDDLVTATPTGTVRTNAHVATRYTAFALSYGDQGAIGTTSYGYTDQGGTVDNNGIALELFGIDAAFEFAHGVVVWANADASGTTYVVKCGFQPKALMFWTNGQSGLTDAATAPAAGAVPIRSLGFAASATDRRVVANQNIAGFGNAQTRAAYRADCVVIAPNSTMHRVDLDSIQSDGFTLITDTTGGGADYAIFWAAWGGTDITDAATGEIAEPGATGNQSYTVGAGWQPTVALFGGCQETAAAPTTTINDSGIMVGAATATGAGNQWVLTGNSDENSATMDTDRYMRGDECVAMIAVAGGNPNARAQFNGFDSAGFDLNWVARGLTGRKYIYLAIKGGQWKAGTTTVNNTTINNTVTVSGLAFQPRGGLIVGHDGAEQAAGTSTTGDKWAVGCFSSPNDRRAKGFWDEDGTANVELDLSTDYDAVLSLPAADGTLDIAIDLNTIASDGFQLIVDTAGGSASDFLGYLAFAPAVAGAASLLAQDRGIRRRLLPGTFRRMG